VWEVGVISFPGDIVSFLREAFPDLRVERIVALGEGWDSVAFLVNESVVFRIPKRPTVARQMASELAILRVVRRYVSVTVPDIRYIGPHLGKCLSP
jgi:hypothetical protein